MSTDEATGGAGGGSLVTDDGWGSDFDGAGFSDYAGSFGGDVSGPTGGQGGDQEHWSGRMPPQDPDAEQSVLGSMLISKDAIADVNEQINGTDFYRPAHEIIYDAIVDLYGRGEPADPVTVSAELQRRGELTKVGGAPYLHTLSATVPIAANAGFYATIVREKSVLRRLVDAGTKIAQMGYAQEGDVDQTVDAAQQEVYAIGRSGRRRTTRRSRRSWSPPSTRSRRSRTTTAPPTACRPASPTSTS